MTADWVRLFRHWLCTRRQVHRAFSPSACAAIEQATRQAEASHRAEVRFVAEAALDTHDLRRGQTARDRALDLFGLLRMWDTEHRTGVLIYLLLADHRIEIVADRGIARCVPQARWDAICREMEQGLQRSEFEAGAVRAIAQVAELLQSAPGTAAPDQHPNADGNEISDRPLVLPR